MPPAERVAALARLGLDRSVARSVVRPGAATSSIRALECAARLKHALSSHIAMTRAAAAQAAAGREHDVSVIDGVERLELDFEADQENRGSGGGDFTFAGSRQQAAAQADAAALDALESQMVDVVTACNECVAGLLSELEQAHRRARISKTAGAEVMTVEEATGGRTTSRSSALEPVLAMLINERAQAVRRSRAGMCGQHDLLSHLISCRSDQDKV